jgi:hypothetical protein
MKSILKFVCVNSILATLGAANAATLLASGYTENFDSLGTLGTTRPTDWTNWVGAAGTSNSTWTATSGISSADVAAMTLVTNPLTAVTTPTVTNNNGFNAAASTSNTSDRVLATSPTTTAGNALQVVLTNNTGNSFNSLLVSYDIVRYAAATTAGELPGYQLFYSLNNAAWTNAVLLNPTLTGPGGVLVPNSAGVTNIAPTLISLSGSVGVGSNLWLRWVDDNGVPTSPDQIYGLNNVSVAAIPEPTEVAMLLAGLLVVGAIARRRKSI